jgi:flavin-dependent dehydrogenase
MRTSSLDADAIVIGGGPGGSWSALKLARLGWRVVVVERGRRHRDKSCGHILNGRAMDVLRRDGVLGAVVAGAIGRTHRFRVHGSHGAIMETALNAGDSSAEAGGLIIERHQFDQLLLDRAMRAGAVVMQRASARLLALDGDGAAVEITGAHGATTGRTNLVIGADGVGSAVARVAGLVGRRSAARKYGFSFEVPLPVGARRIRDAAIDMYLTPNGYLGMVSHGAALHVAALVGNRAGDTSRQPLHFVHQAAAQYLQLQELGFHRMATSNMRHFKAIGPMPWRPRNITRDAGCANAVLVGDAAGFIEPFTGEGIAWAIVAAEALGHAASSCEPGRWTAATSATYARAWHRQVGRRQRLCAALAWAVERPMVASVLMHVASKWPRLADRVAAEVALA